MKCIEDEIPFEIPGSWAWCRFGTYTINRDNERKPVSLSNRKDVEKNYDYYGASGKIDKIDNYLFDEKLLLIGEDGANLVARTKPIAFFAEGKYWVNNHAHCIDAIDKQLLEFLYYYINAIDLKMYITGAAQPKLNQDNMNKILLSIPPKHEQEKIICEISNSFQCVLHIDNHMANLKAEISLLKSKILDLAIRGKLVPQDPNDEPASVLLERIKVEKEELIKQGKIKRDKKESVIFKGEDNSYYEKIGNSVACIDDELPFEIPSSWIWCRLGEIFSHNIGKALNSSDTTGCLMTYITTSNLYWNRFVLDSLKKMRFSENEIEKCTVRKGDLLVCEGGDIGRAAIWEHDEEIRIQNHIHKLRPYAELSISNRFYYYIFYLWKQMDRIGGHGIGLQGFSSRVLHNLLIPLPPFKEQLSIVSKIDCLFSVLEGIEKSLN